MLLSAAPIYRKSLPFRRGLGDAAADAANYRAMALAVPNGSYLQKIISDCAENPTPDCARASASWFSGGYLTADQATQINASLAAGGPIPFEPGAVGPPPGTYLPTSAPAPLPAPAAISTSAPAPLSTSPAVSSTAPAVSKPVTSQLINTTRGGSSFQVGDAWQLIITGPANQPVYITGTFNGQSLGQTQLGVTDSSGNFQTGGSMTVSQVGTWFEQYSVGGISAGSSAFQVTQAPGPTPTQSTTPVDVTDPSTGLATQTPTPPDSGAPALPGASSSVTIGGVEIPVWALGLGAVGLLLFFGKGQF